MNDKKKKDKKGKKKRPKRVPHKGSSYSNGGRVDPKRESRFNEEDDDNKA